MKYAMALENSKVSVLKNSLIVLILFLLFVPELALASVGGGGALPYDELAAAASQELCWPLTLQKPARPQPGVAPVALVSDPVLLRVRAIAAGTQPIAVRLQTVDCLRVAGTQQDKALLLQLLTAAKAAKIRK